MSLKVLHNKIFVEDVPSTANTQKSGLFATTEVTESQGIITAIASDYEGFLKVGQQVIYGRDIQNIRVSGKNLKVMDVSNILAVVNED
jgi:co-chaperonin GroES (HSP10)